jgi:hypothetical protein
LFIDEAPNMTLLARAMHGVLQPKGVFYGGADDVIHPDLAILALEMEREFKVVEAHPTGRYLPRGRLHPATEITYRCGCLNSRPAVGKFVLTEEAIANAVGIPIV